jgi:hypothetical protein
MAFSPVRATAASYTGTGLLVRSHGHVTVTLRLKRLSPAPCLALLLGYPPLALAAHAPRPDAMRGCYRSGPAHAPTPDSDILRPHQPRLGDAPKLPFVFVP